MSYLVSADYGDSLTSQKASMYETLEPAGLSTELNQHFVEWFSGDTLDSIWTTIEAGTGFFGMFDGVNGGYKMEVGDLSDRTAQLTFNSINHYSETASVFICVFKNNETTFTQNYYGTTSTNPLSSNNSTLRTFRDATFFDYDTHDASTESITTTSITKDTNTHKLQIELKSSVGLLYLDGVLEVVKSSNLPTVTQQPHIYVRNKTTAFRSSQFSYLEVYNT